MTMRPSSAKTFWKREDGVALVEFAVLLPLMLLAFFTIVEFSRLFFSYQGAIEGVRDAVRYMARTSDPRVCDSATGSSTVSTAVLTTASGYNSYIIIENAMDTETPGDLPEKVTLNSVTERILCREFPVSGSNKIVPMAEIEANFTVIFPLVGILEFAGQPLMNPISHTLSDETRIYGL